MSITRFTRACGLLVGLAMGLGSGAAVADAGRYLGEGDCRR